MTPKQTVDLFKRYQRNRKYTPVACKCGWVLQVNDDLELYCNSTSCEEEVVPGWQTVVVCASIEGATSGRR